MKKIVPISSLILLIAASAAFAAGIPQEKVTRPEGTEAFQGDRAELVAKGETLWNDKSLSSNGKKACAKANFFRPGCPQVVHRHKPADLVHTL